MQNVLKRIGEMKQILTEMETEVGKTMSALAMLNGSTGPAPIARKPRTVTRKVDAKPAKVVKAAAPKAVAPRRVVIARKAPVVVAKGNGRNSEEANAKRSAAMKASWERRRAGQAGDNNAAQPTA